MTITVEHLSKGVSLVTLSVETSRNGLNMESMKSMSDIMTRLQSLSSIDEEYRILEYHKL